MSYPNRFTIPQGNYPGQPYAGADLCTANSDNASPSDFEDEIEIARDYPPQSYWRDFEDGRLHALRTNRGYAMGDLAPFMDMMHLQSPSSYTRPSESYNRPGTVPLRGQDTAKQGPSFVGSDLSAHWAAHESQLAQAHARAFPGPSPGFQMDFSRMEQSVPGHNIAPRASQTAPGMPGGTNIPPSNAAAGSGPEIAGRTVKQMRYQRSKDHPPSAREGSEVPGDQEDGVGEVSPGGKQRVEECVSLWMDKSAISKSLLAEGDGLRGGFAKALGSL